MLITALLEKILVEKMSNHIEDNRQHHQKDDYLQPNGKVPHGNSVRRPFGYLCSPFEILHIVRN
jgi:hypothetical protein